MTKRHFGEMRRAQEARGKFLCIGLDIDLRKMPISFRAGGNAERAIRNFGCFLVEQTRDIIFAPDPREASLARDREIRERLALGKEAAHAAQTVC